CHRGTAAPPTQHAPAPTTPSGLRCRLLSGSRNVSRARCCFAGPARTSAPRKRPLSSSPGRAADRRSRSPLRGDPPPAAALPQQRRRRRPAFAACCRAFCRATPQPARSSLPLSQTSLPRPIHTPSFHDTSVPALFVPSQTAPSPASRLSPPCVTRPLFCGSASFALRPAARPPPCCRACLLVDAPLLWPRLVSRSGLAVEAQPPSQPASWLHPPLGAVCLPFSFPLRRRPLRRPHRRAQYSLDNGQALSAVRRF
ncbi:hypothetical protein BDY21DRAFT_312018, partial [Lineolata rhizophorae]